MSRFVAIGECMIELSPTGTERLWQQGIAGDTLNTAWYARAALPDGWQVDYVTRLGTDAFSDGIVEFLARNGLGTGHITRDQSRGPGLYAITLKDGERSFTYWRSDSAARHLADDPAALERALNGANIAFVSGITIAILPPAGRAALQEALAAARKAGCIIAFDPNIRPRLWEDPGSARHWISRFATCATVALPSFDDDAATFGDETPAATLARYQAAGVPEVVVKNGGREVCWAVGGKTGAETDMAVVQPVDSTGAGDSFNGAYLAARLQGGDVAFAIRAGHAVAVKVIGHRGALLPQAALSRPDSRS